ncbi:glycosyltransferase [Streptomyces sp. NPDC015131]|uniref:glycosyltransferase n=1 Tax=Streptomyces sp. NPDC015131 TaxID=3364941 RepID=UPI0036F9AEE0
MTLRTAVTAEPIPSHVSALDYVVGPALGQGHHVTVYAPPMFRREVRRRRADFRAAGVNWTCDPGLQRAAGRVWRSQGNAAFNRYVFGRLWPRQAAVKARDLIGAWRRDRPDLVIAECSDPGAHLAARVLRLPLVAADNGLGPVLVDLWDTHVAPALLPLYERYGQDSPTLPPMLSPAPLPWFFPAPPASARAVRRTLPAFRTAPFRHPGVALRPSRPLVYVSLGTLATAMSGLRTVAEGVYREVMAAVRALDCDAIVSAGDLAPRLPSAGPHITVVTRVPQPALLHRAGAFVTHAGRASLLDAVQAATPVLSMGVLADQPGNAAAFSGRGLGRSLDVTAGRDEIAGALSALLGTSRHATAMRAARAELSRLPPLDLAALRDGATGPVPACGGGSAG